MEGRFLPRFHFLFQERETYAPPTDDLPTFEEAFNTDSLRKFYQHQNQRKLLKVNCCSGAFADETNDCNIEETSSVPDDRDTEASPILRYNNKLGHPMAFSETQSPIALSHPFYADDLEMMPGNPFGGLQDPFRSAQELNFDNLESKQASAKVPEGKKVFEMRGNLNMTMSFGNITLKGGKQSPQDSRKASGQDTESQSDANFERLVRTKKIFKIQRDTKPKSPTKQKLSINFNKSSSQSPQRPSVKMPINALGMYRGDNVNQSNPQGPQLANPPAPVLSFLNVMQGKGYTPQQVMSQIQMFMQQQNGQENPSAAQKI